ncbi:DUF4295 domain-containing protein [Aliifodinibius sp. S!AR15-10]|jgi:hypothetical protein|uniref:DUF4295 family protein n=1 Tax=Aliifodinibius sp. S!AR15-10 TaxID=2950437 RepID=UPI0028552022|nr:DUF4295 family protein [Aliifodinibius sp. S!AR15-10]MDR8391305.1 DUF4295 domain-containing protein [Aliifodinibius sp. S!AR15-10]
MAKKQVFGEEAQKLKGSHRKMAKVIISTKSTRGKYAFKEAMIDEDEVRDFISQNKEN